MKKLLAASLLIFMLAAALTFATFASDAVVINTADELSAVMRESDKWSGNYKLGADINMRGKYHRSMGTYDVPFSGTFDGDGHSISGLDISAEGTSGLFGVLSGTVKNLKVYGEISNSFFTQSAEAKISGKYSGTGGVVGVALSGATVENCINNAVVDGSGNTGGVIGIVYNFGYESVTVIGCENTGTIYSTAGNCGGVIGRIYVSTAASPAVTVKDCTNYMAQTLKIDNRNRLGGIVGYVRSEAGVVIIEGCTNGGDITAENFGDAASNDYPYAGGIVGRIEATGDVSSGAQISKCSNTGTVSSGKYAGGIVTYIQRSEACADNTTFISECINTGIVKAPRFVGGILGYSEVKAVGEPISVVKNCANYGYVYGTEYAGGILGRQYGMSIKECISAGTVNGNPAGAFVGVAEGTVYCDIDEAYYLATVNAKTTGKTATGSTCISISETSVTADEMKVKDTFKHLDFDNIWTMGENGPTLKMLTGESTSDKEDKKEEEKSPFVQTRTYEEQFTDVSTNQWFYKFVKLSYEYGLASGTSNDSFSPSGKFTVAQALTAAVNVHKAYFAKEVRSAYPGESWYAPYVSYCIDNGIIRYGMFDNYDRNITRGEMAIVFASILPDSEYEAVKDGSNPDVTADMACYDSVSKLFKAGIVGGDAGSGNFRPGDEIVRSEACVIFTRIALAAERAK